MAINIRIPEHQELKPRILVFGIGGAGGNAVNNMMLKNLEGAEFVAANTDAQALQQSNAQTKLQLGLKRTQGLGAGAKPEVGNDAAVESTEQIADILDGANLCFITAGMGGGTGTGAAPIVAELAREKGILTVGVVTKPFQFEGTTRMKQADEGILALQKVVDTLIVIPNQNLFRLATEKTTFTEAFSMADDVLYQGVKGVTDLMVKPGLINLDFADVRSIMDEMGKAMMGTGEASGEDRENQGASISYKMPNGMTVGAFTFKSEDDLDVGEEYSASGAEVQYNIASGLKASITVVDYDYKVTAGNHEAAPTADSGTMTQLTIGASF